ncbi:MAG: hypothetical protein O3C63_09595, partial [Cyanobacteria bacterium]|nr:hypothetical protein [Cyanobacteriota bacterium]
SYRDELIPKEDAENYYYSDFNEKYSLKLDALKRINNLKTGEVESTAVTRSVTETRSSQTVDTSYSLEHFPFKIGKNEDQWGAKFAQLSQDIEEHLKEVKTEIERSKVKQQLENYMTMLNAFQPGSSSAEATQVFISFYQRMLGSI